MEYVPGSFGTIGSFALRLGQTMFSAASFVCMCLDYNFYDYTTFCYLAAVMAIVPPWSIILALTDTYSVLVKLLPQDLKVLFIVVTGDFVLSFLSLSGACAVASATERLPSGDGQTCDGKLCRPYQLSVVYAFLCWFLLLASALLNFWNLPSLYYRN